MVVSNISFLKAFIISCDFQTVLSFIAGSLTHSSGYIVVAISCNRFIRIRYLETYVDVMTSKRFNFIISVLHQIRIQTRKGNNPCSTLGIKELEGSILGSRDPGYFWVKLRKFPQRKLFN